MAYRFPPRSAVAGAGQFDRASSQKPRALTEPAARSLEYWAGVRPDDAVVFEDTKTMTYREWNDYADLLAHTLAHLGLGADDVVAMRCRVRTECAVIASAAAKIDAQLLVIDPGMSARDIRFALAASRAAAFICDDADPGRIAPALAGLPLRLRASIESAGPDFESFWDLFPPCAPKRFARSQSPLVFFTSGQITSSQPGLRGIANTRRIVAPASKSKTPTPDLGATLITGRAPGVSVPVQASLALGAGRRIVAMRVFDPLRTLQAIDLHGVTHWTATPSQIRALMALPARVIAAHDLSTLKTLLIESAPAPPAMLAWIAATFGPVLAQIYDCPEAGVIARLNAELASRKPGAAGMPAAGAEIEIRDLAGRVVPTGTAGEVWARTSTQIERYFASPPEARDLCDSRGFFRVGDVGRRDADGCFFVEGRTLEFGLPATQAGSPSALEAVLKSHPAIQAATVLPPSHCEADLTIFCEIRAGHVISEQDVLTYLRSRFSPRDQHAAWPASGPARIANLVLN